MRKIIGDTTAAPNPRPNWAQTDANKADYIKNKPTLGEMAKKDKVAKEDLSAEVQERLDSMSTASEIKAVSYEPQTLTDGQKAQARLNIGAAELDANGKVPLEQLPPYAGKVTKEDVGLGNVDNIKQYSAENPPPYPVTSVNGQTGSVVIDINTSIPEALPNPHMLTINGTAYDGSKAVSIEIDSGLAPLIGTTDEITPTQVIEAITEGRPVCIKYTDTQGVEYQFASFDVMDNFVISEILYSVFFGDDPNRWIKLKSLKGVLSTNEHWEFNETPRLATVEGLPTTLPNPNALTINGKVYDGSEEVTVNIEGGIDAEWVATSERVGNNDIVIAEQTLSSGIWSKLQAKLVLGMTYEVYINDVCYLCVCYNHNDGGWYLGNGSLAGSNSTPHNNEPFCILAYSDSATSGTFYRDSNALSYPLKLKVTGHSYVKYNKLPKEYLPDCVVKSVNGKAPDENGNVTVSGAGGGVDPEELTAAVESALEEAKASGMFDGEDGVTITRILNEVNEVTGVETNVVYFSDGQVVRITNGEPGADGVSVGIRDIMHNEATGQHIITFTDGTQLTVNDGTDGKDGTSVTVKSVSESTADGGSNVVAFSDGKTLTVRNGTKGSTGKTAYEYAQDGGYEGTEAEFAKELAKTPLVGTCYGASIVKPSQVAKAVAEGRPVEITEGDVIFRDFYIQDNTVTSTILNWSSTGYQPQTLQGILDTDEWRLYNAVKLVDKTQIPTELKNPNKLTINGEDYDGSEAVSMNLSKAPLVGDYDRITPSQVAEAVAENRAVEVTNVDEIYRDFYIEGNEVIGSLLDWSNVRLKVIKGAIDTNEWFFSNTGELANTTQIPTELKNPNRLTINGTAYDGSTEVNMELAKPSDIPTIPTALKNPNALIFTGGASGTYDGSEAKTINIPTVPTALKNPNKLTINGTEYDGSKEVNVSVAKEPLVGTLNNCAPQDVAEAIAEGRPISLTVLINGVEHTFASFGMRDGKILSEIIFQTGDDRREISVAYIEGEFFSDGTGHWNLCVTGQLARMDDIPTALKNPSKLIINGEEYDGSKQIIMNLAKPSDIPSALKNPNALTINGTEYDGSSAVNIKLAKEPLIGSEIEITPSMVADAVQEGRSVVLRCEAFDDTFTSFSILNDKYVVGGAINTGNVNGLQLVCAYGNIETDAWAFAPRNLAETKDIPSIPSALKNPNALAFTGAVTESYDGSEAKTVNIPTVPSALKNPNTLTINGIAYDGSSAVSMELAKLSDIPEVEWMATVPEISGGSVVMETNLNFTSKYHTLNPHWKPVVGYNYDIYWNDDKYTCAIVESSGEAFVGNRSLMSSSYPDTGEPFLFTGWALTNPELTSVQKTTATEEEVSLRIETERIVKCDKLPEVYLPDCVVKSVNGNTPDGAGNVEIAALKNPNALTINGEAYDGSKAVEIELAKKSDIPTVPTALKNPNALTINGTSYDGSSAVSVNIKEGLEPLIGSTAEITPIMVVGAIAEGRSVMLAHTTEDFGRLAFNHFTYAVDIGDVVSSGVVYYQGVYVIVELVGSVSGGSWSVVGTVVAQLSDIPAVPTTLPNPEFLIINGQTYDGEDPLVVDTFVHAVFTYHEESSIGVGGMRVTCDITPSELVSALANKTVIAELKDEGGAYIGSAVFGKKDLFSAVADIVTAGGIYRITAVSGNAGYGVAYTAISSGNGGGIVIFEEKAVSGYFVNNLSFELDAEYDIYWNDKKYVCTSYKSEGEVYTGNGHIINTNLPDTGEPFLFTHMAGASAAMLHKASGQASSNTLMVATHGYNAGGGGTSIDVTAEVGQTIVVEEVDGSGKPTKWRAADYQPKICGCEDVEIQPLTEITPFFEQSLGVPMGELGNFKLTIGNTYKVTFDGVEYVCECFRASMNGMSAPAIGNYAVAGGEDTGEPFAIFRMEVEDAVAGIIFFDMNPHTVQIFEEIVQKIPTKFVPTFEEMTEENVVVLPETTLSENIDGFLIIPADLGLKANQEYTVNYNGVEYVVSNGIAEDDMFRIGNLGVLDVNQPNTGEPFIIAYGSIQHPDGSTTYGWGLAPLDGSASVTLSIKGKRITSVFSQYLSNAFPYYIDVNCETFSNVQTPSVYTCRETVANVTDIFASGREIKVRLTTTGHNATPIVGIYSMYMYAIASEGVLFGFMAGNGYSSVSNIFLQAQAGDNTFTILDSMD